MRDFCLSLRSFFYSLVHEGKNNDYIIKKYSMIYQSIFKGYYKLENSIHLCCNLNKEKGEI